MNSKAPEKGSELSPEAVEWPDWQGSVHQPSAGKLVRQSRNGGAGANVTSDESIRVPVPLELKCPS